MPFLKNVLAIFIASAIVVSPLLGCATGGAPTASGGTPGLPTSNVAVAPSVALPTGTAVPTSISTIPQPPVEWLNVGAPSYGLSWRAPRDWLDAETSVTSPTLGWLLLDARSSQPLGSLPTTPAPTSTVMVLSVWAVPGAVPVPPAAQPRFIASHSGWVLEENTTAKPQTWRAIAFIEGSEAYDYVLAFTCAGPMAATGEELTGCMASCRWIWEGMLDGVQVATEPPCPKGTTPTPGAIVWRRVADTDYGYAFDVPSGWLEAEHVTSDRLTFYSDPAVYGQPQQCPLPNGLVKLDLAADPPGKGPDLAQMVPTVVAGQPAWIASGPAGEAAPTNAIATAVFIRGPRYNYLLSFLCIPPDQEEDREVFATARDAIIAHIVDSFQVVQ